MGIEVWIVLLLLASGGSAWIGYTYARRQGPSQSDLDALEAELDEARQQAESVQANVNEHFEQSAILFGRLANDYREFIDHFSSSAQSLGLSEGRARELLEQGFQPMLTHEDVIDDEVVDENLAEEAQKPLWAVGIASAAQDHGSHTARDPGRVCWLGSHEHELGAGYLHEGGWKEH